MEIHETTNNLKIIEVSSYTRTDNFAIDIPLDLIDEPNKSIFKEILCREWRLYQAKGSDNNHQNWRGGYIDHIQECMHLAILFYENLTKVRKLPFSLSDALGVLFLHDIEKPYKWTDYYEEDGETWRGTYTFDSVEQREAFRNEFIKKYNIQLTEEQKNAMKYIHGEGENYSGVRRVMNELAAFCHICDIASARIWHDYPKKIPT